MNVSKIYNISFQKALRADCAVKKNKISTPCKIYEIEKGKEEDKFYFQDLIKNKDWKDTRYLYSIDEYFSFSYNNRSNFYALEDSTGKCLGCCKIAKDSKNDIEVSFIETMPKYQNNDDNNSNIQYIGQSLLAFIAQIAKKNKSKRVYLCPSLQAIDYYPKQYFHKDKTSNHVMYELKNTRYDRLIRKNTRKTGQKVELV